MMEWLWVAQGVLNGIVVYYLLKKRKKGETVTNIELHIVGGKAMSAEEIGHMLEETMRAGQRHSL